MTDRTVSCQQVSCAMRGMVVTTDIEKCLSCGEPLQPVADLLSMFKDLYR